MMFKDKITIVTGAANGIGKETAKLFASEGSTVILCDNCKESLKALDKEFKKCNYKYSLVFLDVKDFHQVNETFDKIRENYGKIDILINNAGITSDAQLKNMTDDQFNSVIDVNLKGVFNCTKAVVTKMIEQGSGVILNASSIVGLQGNFGQTNYAASKWGVIGMTKTWAKELGSKGIRVNAIAPGFVLSNMTKQMPDKVLQIMRDKTPLKRLGQPNDIAKAYLFLASNDASFITGTVLSVDGGLVI